MTLQLKEAELKNLLNKELSNRDIKIKALQSKIDQADTEKLALSEAITVVERKKIN